MAYVITETCIDVKDGACVEVCPVDCITSGEQDRMLFIEPDECIDCGACVDVCPVDAIYAEEDVPHSLTEYIALNRRHFIEPEPVRERVNELSPQTASSPVE